MYAAKEEPQPQRKTKKLTGRRFEANSEPDSKSEGEAVPWWLNECQRQTENLQKTTRELRSQQQPH